MAWASGDWADFVTERHKTLVAVLGGTSLFIGIVSTPLSPVFGAFMLINAVCCFIVLTFGFGEWGE